MAKTPGALAITDAEIEDILVQMGDGMTLMGACKKAKRSYANIVRRINTTPELKHLHARVREEYIRAQVDRMHEIAADQKIDPARARLMIDAIKWESARVLPKEFGDRVQQEVIINDNRTLSTRMNQARARARQQAEAIATQLPPKGQEDENE